MNFLTHLKISKVTYKYLNNYMYLDKRAFVYGNIKPDLSVDLMKNPHTLDNYFGIMCNHIDNIMHKKLDLYEYSVELGQICHYLCDFFCFYHLNEEIWGKKKEHFIYELKLHLGLLKNTSKWNLNSVAEISENKISAFITGLRREYESKTASIKQDLEYSLIAITSVCVKLSDFSPNFVTEFSFGISDYCQPINIEGGSNK